MSEWTAKTEQIAATNGLRIEILRREQPVPFADVIDARRSDRVFRGAFTDLLADAPLEAFRWETPGVTVATSSRPFEFVLIGSPGLGRNPGPDAFREHFDREKHDVVTFANLGRDATLIVPRPLVEPSAYGHLAAFVRSAPESQRHELWQAVGNAMAERISSKPVWLSTAGAGVPWLHIRLDDLPKYYCYAPYELTP